MDRARRRAKALGRILGVDAALDRVTRAADVLLLEPERLAGGNADLGLDQVDSRDHLGDRVLDLDPGVDFDEVELARGGRR